MNRFKMMQNQLDRIGIATAIRRVHKHHYDFIVNFEIIKSYRQRASCNRQIIKLCKKKQCRTGTCEAYCNECLKSKPNENINSNIKRTTHAHKPAVDSQRKPKHS